MRTYVLGFFSQFFPTSVEGRENIPTDEPFVCVVGPHKSYLETVIVPTNMAEVEFHIMAKASLFKVPIFGWIFRNAGGIPVQRTSGHSVLSISPAVEELRKGYPVINFPEGTRFIEDDDIHLGKTGPVRIALEAETKIVLVVLMGMRRGSKVPRAMLIQPPFDPRIELLALERQAGRSLKPAEAYRQLTDMMMQRMADVLNVRYVGDDERGGRA